MLGRLGAQLGRSLQLSSFKIEVLGPANGARTLAAFAGNFRQNVGYAQAPPQEEASPPSQSGRGGLREVPFSKDITNHIRVMGRLGFDPELKRLETGRTVTKMRIALSKPKSASTDAPEEAEWIDVESWDSPGNELATLAATELRKGTRVAVQGRLRIDRWQDRTSGETKTKAKIVADDLALVGDPVGMESGQGAPSYASQGGGFAGGGSTYASTSAASPATSASPGQKTREELWESYFADPTQWWDNRQGKTNPRAPDFKHKETKEALWIDDRRTPPYVLTRLAEENPAAGPQMDLTLEELWENLYEDPGSWWDNRKTKKLPDAPDFVHRETRQGLRISDPNAPDYLVSKEALEDLDGRFKYVADMERQEYMDLWEDVFKNPHNWFDNRVSKRNERAPDFVNKENREIVLWLNDKRNTPEILERISGALKDVSGAMGSRPSAQQLYGS